jgi:hypothetical protein
MAQPPQPENNPYFSPRADSGNNPSSVSDADFHQKWVKSPTVFGHPAYTTFELLSSASHSSKLLLNRLATR